MCCECSPKKPKKKNGRKKEKKSKGALGEFSESESQGQNSVIFYWRKCRVSRSSEISSTDSRTPKTPASKQEQVNSTSSLPPSASFKLIEDNFSFCLFVWSFLGPRPRHSSQARDQTHTMAVTRAAAAAKPDP